MLDTPLVAKATGFALLFVALVVGLYGQAQTTEAPVESDFPIAEFREREETAEWLLRYDWAAWKSSDVVMSSPKSEREKLGPGWYCCEEGRTWDCYYGKYDFTADRFDVVIHLQSKNRSEFVRVPAEPAPEDATTFARAVLVSLAAAPKEVQSAGFRFNSYIRRTGAGEIEVWLLPAGQPDGTLFYGGDFCQTLDATGTRILATTFAFNGFRGVKANRELELFLENESDDIATVGSIFFILQFGEQFKSVTVVGRKYLSRLVKAEREESWVHAERQVKEPAKVNGLSGVGP
ncbi:MAG: hypothetical protein MUE47_06050 [Acidobacteria bacterium]|nr:hypothetical protein [Acidobacteriota bacterium]